MTMLIERSAVAADQEIAFGDLHPELYPGLHEINQVIIEATAIAAIVTKVIVEEEFDPVPAGEKLPSTEKDRRVEILDNTGAMVERIQLSKEKVLVDFVGAEGGKEKQADKGGLILDVVRGIQGNGEKLVWSVQDILEGTSAATHNRPGAISIIATTTAGGIIPTPEQRGVDSEGKKHDIEYMEKLMGPPALAGKIGLDREVEENLQAAMDEFGVSASDIEVTILKRPRNEALIARIEAFGGTVRIIDAGDLVPSLEAMGEQTDGKVRFVMGIGGWEEGVIAACAAKALGAVAEGRMAEVWKEDGVEKHVIYPEYLRLDDLVPANKEECSVNFTAVTDIKAFDLKGVDLEKGEAQGLTIDHTGFRRKIIPFFASDARRARADAKEAMLAAAAA